MALHEAEHVLLTPHNAFNTHEALEEKARQSSEAIVAFLKHQAFPDSIPDEDELTSAPGGPADASRASRV
jgi:phosphoglycerate dehydrogenase-like enzyme